MGAVAAMPRPFTWPRRRRVLPHRMAGRLGPAPVLLVGFAMQLAWAFFGSLVLGLGRRPPPGGSAALIWIAGAVALFLLTVSLVRAASPGRSPRR